MTTTVKVTACCAPTIHVQVRLMRCGTAMQDDTVMECHYLQDGETKEVYVYDNLYVITRELVKYVD